MAKRRRPNKVRQPVIGLEPILRTSLKAKIGEKSEAARLDGKSGAGVVRPPRHRDQHTEPLRMSALGWATYYACLDELWRLDGRFEKVLQDSYQVGRKKSCSVADVLLFGLLREQLGSARNVDRFFSDPYIWRTIIEMVETAWPHHVERRLSPTGPSRFQYMRIRDALLQVPGFPELHRRLITAANVGSANCIGMGQEEDSLTHPSARNMIVGDATWEKARFNGFPGGFHIDRDTGEKTVRKCDPDAKPYHAEGSAPGNYIVSVQTRTEFPHERLILDAQYKPDGVSDGTVFTDMALNLFEPLGTIRGVAYDMALKAEDHDRIGASGRHVLSHVPMTKGKQVRVESMGRHRFKVGSKQLDTEVISVEGCPTISTFDIEGCEYFVPLKRKQTKMRGKTMYNIFEIPDDPLVPPSMRGGTTLIRCFSSAEEIKSGTRRPSFLRSIPLNDPDFDRLYGLREDTESMHNDLKSRRLDRRARSVGLARREFDIRGYQLHQMAVALLAWSLRTGASIEAFVGKWHPPDSLRMPLAA